MTHADAARQRGHGNSHATKKRTWREGADATACGRVRPFGTAPNELGVHGVASALLAKYRAFSAASGGAVALPPPSLVDVLPSELLAQVLAFVDGPSLLRCAESCRAMARLSHARDVWRNICMQQWPSLRAQVLPQLPGAPDYDLIRLYGGSWRRCFVERHRRDQRAQVRVEIPQFASAAARGVDKVVSETFAIGEHRFCLWVFPNGNPNEPQYVGRVLSVYLVLTDLEQRAPDWLTCAVFSLAVEHPTDPGRRIEWHSCLVDNKFDSALHNWGIHSLGSLKTLRAPASGYLHNDALTVTANVRLMSITFRVVFEKDLQRHRQLGLADFEHAETLELPFCCSLQDLLKQLHDRFGVDPHTVRVWCSNQPVVSGQALRPRKRLTQQPKVNKTQPLFGNLLCDGVDIDAYSFCLLYVEVPEHDEPVLNALELASLAKSATTDDGTDHDDDHDDDGDGDVDMESASPASSAATSVSSTFATGEESTATTTTRDSSSYLFVKVLDPETLEFLYLGRFALNADGSFSTASLYESAARKLRCSSYELSMFKEEIAPTLFSGPIAWSTDSSTKCGFAFSLQPADIVVFTHTSTVANGVFESAVRAMLQRQYHEAERMLARDFTAPTLAQIETLAERLDIPKFRVRSAFRKCREDGRNTLRYIMEGRHLGFICDSCGETDFKGARFNCTVCSDYDLCRTCHAKSHEVSHRYANVDGKWQRVYEFKDHTVDHAMREMLPVFYDYAAPTHRALESTEVSTNTAPRHTAAHAW